MNNNNFKIDISLKSEKKKREIKNKIITKRKTTDATSQNKFVKSKTKILFSVLHTKCKCY